MRPPFRTSLPAIAVLIATAASSPSLSAQNGAPGDVARLDALFAEVNTDSTPGCVAGIARSGLPVLLRAYGMANLETRTPNTPRTIFEAGSVSKQFTAAAVLMLARAGRLSLDDDVRSHLPELPDWGAPVTLRQMLNHTSGLRDWGNVVELTGWPRGTRVYTQDDVLRVAARQRALNSAPGAEYLYSNTNYTLAAIVVERVSGVSFAEFTRRALLQPVGMTHSSWREDFGAVVAGRAQAYGSVDGGGWRLNMPFENTLGHAGLLTTVEDLLRWNANLESSAVGGAGFGAEMAAAGRLASGRAIPYALGLEPGMRRGVAGITHAGATGGYHSFLGRYPERGLSVAILCNAGSINTEDLGPRVADLFLPAPPPTPGFPVRATAETETRDVSAVAGLYRNARTRMPVTITALDGGFSVNGAAPYLPRSATSFGSADGSRQATLLPDAGGGRGELLIVRSTGDSTRLIPVAAADTSAAAVAAMVGTYRSDEADATVSIRARDGGLELRMDGDRAMRLEPAYEDALIAPDDGWLFVLRRDMEGRITGMSAWIGRSRDIRFDRR
ncbi:serine hydrolase domain-containing protein [Longimicrobium terrae]|uniref:CubicO group peptidase (Beta-lactamase class C family) n=1 Tax=Longimicrobium terrae TaxID=1639882 RepID=A0A841H4P1_9BACT|nr:serine hydrolase domain-containing protein [Longimicrobium terrae]MBB4638693.1 CubicO group peptidase (beta-lactamase class C family) [Longimicrobium terrae]MBB6072933.1 CubicO group peptidase (beta-lactamase class C family) [Longimicrobium terrae]NNC31545.1 beta-lactamase family protein [Longimicrobium terrae]